jgi:hypothetical protein
MMRGFKRLAKPVKHSKPLPFEALKKACDKWRAERSALGLLKAVACTAAFFAMFRVSEYTAKTAKQRSAMRLKHISFKPIAAKASRIHIRIPVSKTNQFGERQDEAIFACTCGFGLCAFHLLAEWIRKFPSTDPNAAIFRFPSDCKALRRSNIDSFVKEIGKIANIAVDSTHVLRSGGANFLFENGLQLLYVERLGRWAVGSIALRRHYIAFQASQAAVEVAAIARQYKRNCRALCGPHCMNLCKNI